MDNFRNVPSIFYRNCPAGGVSSLIYEADVCLFVHCLMVMKCLLDMDHDWSAM